MGLAKFDLRVIFSAFARENTDAHNKFSTQKVFFPRYTNQLAAALFGDERGNKAGPFKNVDLTIFDYLPKVRSQ